MFIYLSKKIKISLQGNVDLNAVAWNREHGWIAVGGEQGEKNEKNERHQRQKNLKLSCWKKSERRITMSGASLIFSGAARAARERESEERS